MEFNLPPKIRKALYIIGVIGTPVIAYLRFKNYIGDGEVAFWGALMTATNGLAALNVKEN